MTASYHTGDDVAYEMLFILMAVSVLITSPSYVEAIPLPSNWVVVLTGLVGMVVFYISHGRIFWALIGAVAWLVMKLAGIKDDGKVWEVHYDEEGKPHLVEKKKEAEA